MKKAGNKRFRFIRLRLCDYRILRGVNDIRFNPHRTLIVGKGGTGKTIISDTLKALGHSYERQKRLPMEKRARSSIAVITNGDSDLINKHKDLIFLSGDTMGELADHMEDPSVLRMVPVKMRKSVLEETKRNFYKILAQKPWKIKIHRDTSPCAMAAGEKICLGYAFVFAVRRSLGLDVPIVIDSPYSRLDAELRTGLRDFMKAHSCQQILLCHECELLGEDDPAYVLVYMDNYSQVMEY